MRPMPASVKKREIVACEIIKIRESHNVILSQVPGIFSRANEIIDSTHYVSFSVQEPACSE